MKRGDELIFATGHISEIHSIGQCRIEKSPPEKIPERDFLTDGDCETFAPPRRFIHDHCL